MVDADMAGSIYQVDTTSFFKHLWWCIAALLGQDFLPASGGFWNGWIQDGGVWQKSMMVMGGGCLLVEGWVGKYIYMGGSDNEFRFDMNLDLLKSLGDNAFDDDLKSVHHF